MLMPKPMTNISSRGAGRQGGAHRVAAQFQRFAPHIAEGAPRLKPRGRGRVSTTAVEDGGGFRFGALRLAALRTRAGVDRRR